MNSNEGKFCCLFFCRFNNLKDFNIYIHFSNCSFSFYRTAGWENCEYVEVSWDLGETLQNHLKDMGPSKVAHIRSLSFVVPIQGAMDEVSDEWRSLAIEAGGILPPTLEKDASIMAAIEAAIPYDDEDDDDDDFLEMTAEAMSVMAGGGEVEELSSDTAVTTTTTTTTESSSEATVVSPFESSKQATATNDKTQLAFTKENVDQVLEEVRPYLISDGGNVSVEKVDEEMNDVYLKLEGACGSCPSSTVTMKMGIERVLKENFPNLNQVLQIEDKEGKPTELTYQVIEQEVNRIAPAIIAMGGVVRIVSVDPIGVVKLEFRGANKVRQGLELAIMDIEFVKHVEFVMGDN
jgi:Fe-S cluster biogenesis protein NfuA